MAGMLSGMLVLSVSSCVKDDFDRYQNGSDALSFKVEVSGGWSEGIASSSTTSIRRMSQSTDAEPLYLVTKVSDSAPVSAESGVVTRGTPVKDATTLEDGGFGLSAICYTGEWPAEGSTNNWTTNFAHNLNVTKQDGHWKASEKLEWPGSGKIRFFAYYPYSKNSAGSIAHSDAGTGLPVLTYTVPQDVKNQHDLLCAVADHSGKSEGNGTVNLEFKHALTAVTIKTGTDMLSGTITGVKISGVYGDGRCTIGGTTWTTQGETRDFEIKGLEVKMSPTTEDKNGLMINTGAGQDITSGEFTFMMVPQTLPEGAKLTINFTDDLTSTARTLTADIGGMSWPSGKKVAYSINSRGIVVETKFEFSKNPDGDIMPYSGVWYDATYKATVDVTQVNVETKTIKIPADKVKFQYRFKDSDPWVDCTPADGLLKIASQPAYETMRADFDTDTEVGTESPVSLTVNGETANCYLVDKAGYYSLPLVYGNGNVSDPVEKAKGLNYYPKHDDGRMPSDGKISGVSDAVLCWQDAPDLIDPASVHIDKSNNTLVFHIRKQTLTQGNALLAVRNDSKEIIWSWHIWVTPYKTAFYRDFYNSSADGYSYPLAKYNLGWCDRHDHNDSRTFSLKAIVDMSAYGGDKETSVDIWTFKQDVFKGSDAGDNTYYQWGRKDPMLGGIYNDYTKEYQYNKKGGSPDKNEFTMENKQVFNQYNQDIYNYSFCKNPGDMVEPSGGASKGVTIGYSIQHPYMFVTNSTEYEADKSTFNYRNHWHIPYADNPVEYLGETTHIMFNAWNSGALDAGYEYGKTGTLANNAEIVTKSVYDPCPPEFQMPPIHALRVIQQAMKSYQGNNDSAKLSYSNNAWTITDTGGSITFPMTGVRNYALRSNEWKTVSPVDNYTEFYKISMPAFRMLTFVSSATIVKKESYNAYQVYIILIDRDKREKDADINNLKVNFTPSSNSYGLAVRPMHYTAGK